MKSFLLLAATILVTGSPWVLAEGKTDHHRAVYNEINGKADRFKKVVDSTSVDDAGVSLVGWIDGKEVRKITATTGSNIAEFYLEDEKPLFVFNQYDRTDENGKVIGPIEERIYFENADIIEWLVNKDLGYALHAEDYISQSKALRTNAASFIKVLKGKREVTEGVFLGIEQGDYFHWKMRSTDGDDLSLFILNPDPSVEKVVENPERFQGKTCRVTWKTSKQKIPESGGSMKVDQILSVDWL